MTLYVATSKPHAFARRIVDHFGLSPFFRGVHGSELDGTRADKGELIGHVLHVEALMPGVTVMVGDRSHDVRGAMTRGILSIGVLWGYGSREELTAAGADTLCEHPAMLTPLLRAHRDRFPGGR
jgi:phosphoglycolate phosphatase